MRSRAHRCSSAARHGGCRRRGQRARVGEHEVELAGREGVVGEGGVLRAADDIVGRLALALQQQVGRADGVGLGVDLLAEQVRGDVLAALGRKLAQRLLGDGEHPAGAAGPS